MAAAYYYDPYSQRWKQSEIVLLCVFMYSVPHIEGKRWQEAVKGPGNTTLSVRSLLQYLLSNTIKYDDTYEDDLIVQ